MNKHHPITQPPRLADQDLLDFAKDLPPAGSLELYQLFNEKECADERRRWDQALADTIYRSTHRTSSTGG